MGSYLIFYGCFGYITIDTEEELNTVGFTTCDYMETYAELCKIAPSTPNSGFWSSCAIPSGNCDLSIRIEYLEELPELIEIHTYLSGSVTEMRLRHQSADSSRPTNIAEIPISNSGSWGIYTHDLTMIEDFTLGSTINIRFSSIPGARDFPDILDKIIFKFPWEIEPTSIEPITTTTTERPSPNVILDISSDITEDWYINCVYQPNIINFHACQMFAYDDGSVRNGFWSSCQNPQCTIAYDRSRRQSSKEKAIPTSIVVDGFVSGRGNVNVAVLNGADIQNVGEMSETGWIHMVYDLRPYGLDGNSVILVELSSNNYPYHVDLIDKITVRFNDPTEAI